MFLARKSGWTAISNWQMCIPISSEERTVVKNLSLKTLTWTGWSGKIATLKKK